jgi:iduronate 2-sulfatase
MKRTFSALFIIAGISAFFFLTSAQKPASKPNVLFIFVDDLRPDLAVYGNKQVHSPNLDKLAAQGALFTRQYVTQPTCGASRYSLLSGKRPVKVGLLKNDAIETEIAGKARTETPETFIDNLRRNGYYTVGMGKISHSPDGYLYGYLEEKSDRLELPYSWDEMLFDPGKWKTGWNAFLAYADCSHRRGKNGKVKPYEGADVPDEGYPDGLTANLAVDKLKELSTKKQPFFLGVGFFKPHLPFTAPKKYWDLYDESTLELTHSPGIPEHINTSSLHGSSEFNQYDEGEEKASLEKPLSDAYARKMRHAYYAAISYTDAQIGKVIDQLKKSGLYENTIVVVWGDHGWHLGDHRVWGKHTLFEQSLRSALIVKTPGSKKASVRNEIISSVDIYPTLMELCGVKSPAEIDGKSFAPLLRNPKSNTWQNAAYSYYNHGITVRNDRYRLTRYFRKQEPVVELYDHQTDPFEEHNVALKYPHIVNELSALLEKGDTGLYKK